MLDVRGELEGPIINMLSIAVSALEQIMTNRAVTPVLGIWRTWFTDGAAGPIPVFNYKGRQSD